MQFPKSALLLLPYLSASICALPSPGSENAILSVRQENKFPPEGVVCQTAQEKNTYSNAALQTAWANLTAALNFVARPQLGATLDRNYRGDFDPRNQVNSNNTVVWYSDPSYLVAYALTGQDVMIARLFTGNLQYSAVLTNSDAVETGARLPGKGKPVGYHQCNDVVPAPAR